MNFAEIMNSIGVESMEYTEPTLEAELMDEIALESELDKNFAEMEAMSIVSTSDNVDAIVVALAEREISLESNIGRDSSEIYKEFGLEAIKDVAARKYYGGVASLKALINTCISWLKNLVGIATSAKKIFTGLKKKADNQLKALRKLAGKNTDKLKRDMHEYSNTLSELLKLFNNQAIGNLSKTMGNKSMTEVSWSEIAAGGAKKHNVETAITSDKSTIDKIKTAKEELPEKYDKSDKDEYEEGSAYSHIVKVLGEIKSKCEANSKNDLTKDIQKAIKNMEQVRDKALKDDEWVRNNTTMVDTMRTFLNTKITLLNYKSSYSKDILKHIVRLADDALTDGKAIEAALV